MLREQLLQDKSECGRASNSERALFDGSGPLEQPSLEAYTIAVEALKVPFSRARFDPRVGCASSNLSSAFFWS
jgi:hypothetical protein